MSKNYEEYLKHILVECDFIVGQTPITLSKTDFFIDEKLKRAIVRS